MWGAKGAVPAYHPHFGQASTLVPLVFVIWAALFEPSALIKKIAVNQGGARRVPRSSRRKCRKANRRPVGSPHRVLTYKAALPLFFSW